MNLQDIQKRVQEIKDISGDDEVAHAMEDDLYVAFVKFVSENGSPELSEMAKEVLKTENIDFARWYA